MTGSNKRVAAARRKQAPNTGSKVRPRAARLSPVDRAAQIRRSALAVLAEKGIGHSNHTQVAAAAGVSLPTVLLYFPTHRQLTDAVLADVADFLLNNIARQSIAAAENAGDAIESVLLAFARSIDAHRDMVRVWLDWSTAIRDEAWPAYLAFHREACRIIEEVVAEGQGTGAIRPEVEPAQAAKVIVGLAHMIGQMNFTGTDIGEIGRTVRSLLIAYLGISDLPAPAIAR